MKSDTVPDWPQPQGIFELRTIFKPLQFLTVLRDIYDKVVTGNVNEDDLAMEYEAFGKLLHRRIITDAGGACLFKLFALETPISMPSELIVEYDGAKYLHIDCLRNSQTD